MRRRSRDVFELGEEQLLDEPAVELSDAEAPLAIPPTGGGPADEERGPDLAVADDGAAGPGRPPILGAIRRAGSIRSAAGAALIVGVLTFAATQLLADSTDESAAPKARPERVNAPARISTQARNAAADARPRAARERPRERGPEVSNRTSRQEAKRPVPPRVEPVGEDASAAMAPAPAAVSPTPSRSQPETYVPSAETTSLSRGEIIYREFGP